MVPGADSVGIPELDALIKMPMPQEDPEEEAEREVRRQATARMRAYRRFRGEEVESEIEMYEDLEPVLVQEVELEGVGAKETEGEDIVYGGSVRRRFVLNSCYLYNFCMFLLVWYSAWGPGGP